MEATIRITVTTIIISRREKPSGWLAPVVAWRCMRRPVDALSIAIHRQRKLKSGAATVNPPLCQSFGGPFRRMHKKPMRHPPGVEGAT
jgi:hypothetical protein